MGALTFGGQPVDSTAVIVRYTYFGDANLDGTVNTTDFNLVASNFGTGGKRWVNGDFNYDGNVNTPDFNLLASNFGQTLPASASTVSASALGALVPEPTTASVIFTLGGLASLRRNRRQLLQG